MHADDLLAALDEEQREVALALRGPVRVLAGAGTGKTRAITHRIAYGVATGVYNPTQVLAVTFTTRAAGEMRTRLRSMGAGMVQARTFHSAATRVSSGFGVWARARIWQLSTWLPTQIVQKTVQVRVVVLTWRPVCPSDIRGSCDRLSSPPSRMGALAKASW